MSLFLFFKQTTGQVIENIRISSYLKGGFLRATMNSNLTISVLK